MDSEICDKRHSETDNRMDKLEHELWQKLDFIQNTNVEIQTTLAAIKARIEFLPARIDSIEKRLRDLEVQATKNGSVSNATIYISGIALTAVATYMVTHW